MQATGIRLSIMMFLQFFIWGAWYVTAPNYLGTIGFGAGDFSWTYSVGPIAGIITPLFVGMVADRFLPAQVVLGLMHLMGAALMYFATTLMGPTGSSPATINTVFFGYMLTYFPTLALTNTVAMKNMSNPERQFPRIRVWGTIGWIVAGVFLSIQGWSTRIEMFQLTAGAALVMGVFSLTLPSTPPAEGPRPTVRELLGLDALVLLKDRNYSIFVFCSMLICIPLAFYYQIASRVVEMVDFSQIGFVLWIKNLLHMGDVIAAAMSLGQFSEIFFMLIMPFFFRRLGVKWMLTVGMLAWVARYTLFSLGAPDQVRWMVLVGVLLHGICYDFFFVTGQIYTDSKAPPKVRAQAQGLLVMLTLGLGMLVGAQAAGYIEGRCTTEESTQLKAEVTALGDQVVTLEKEAKTATGPRLDDLKSEIDALTLKKNETRSAELRAIDWKPLWAIPAAFAAIVMVLFVLLFHGPKQIETDMLIADS